MSSTRELRRRIKSVKNTSQITKAMQMVAATKMRRAQNQALGGRSYNQNLNEALIKILPRIETLSHPLLVANESKSVGVILLTTDKGLCGALNSNIFRATYNFTKEKTNLQFYTIGKKGRGFVVKTGKELKADFENSDVVTFRQAKQITKMLIDLYLKKELGEVYLIYADFVSSLRQEPRVVRLLPIDKANLKALETSLTDSQKTVKVKDDITSEFLIEPDPIVLLGELLIHYLEIEVYQALLETKASEHSARMVAMKNATDNAKELVGDLQLTYNQTRQDNITRELLEITSASLAME